MRFQDAKREAVGTKGQEERAEGENLRPERADNTSKALSDGEPAGVQVSGFRPHSSPPSSICHLLASIRLIVLDFDGVMTDNRVLVAEDGQEAVFCNRGDGLGLVRLRAEGIAAVVISKEKNPVVAARCRKLGIECIQGCDNKLEELKKRAEGVNLKPEEITYVGNDINDLECMQWVGLPVAVRDAEPEVMAVAKWVTFKPGGHGAVREVCDALSQAKRKARSAEGQAPRAKG
jgi:YrbI family 3-deoxy-D-manno-octulosonate 8-phosphate phosphatase